MPTEPSSARQTAASQSESRESVGRESASLRFGTDARFDFPADCNANLIAYVGRPRGRALEAPYQSLLEKLDDPIGFPPLIEATVPGDRVAIAVENGVPRIADVVSSIIASLTNGRIEPADIRVVLPGTLSPVGEHEKPISQRKPTAQGVEADIIARLPTQVGKAIEFEVHDMFDRNRLAYLAAATDAAPFFFNRTICEADLVIPVGCLHQGSHANDVDDSMGLFPTFADEETVRHFSSPATWEATEQLQQRRRRAREAAWLLGVTFTVQVLPGAGGEVLALFAGEREAVFAAGCAEMQEAWSCNVPSRSSLVVAAIEGGQDQQTWANVGSALAAAMKVVDDDGAIVICSELAIEPGVGLAKLRGIDRDSFEDLHDKEQLVADEIGGDAVVAAQLLEALRNARVYLYSRLDESTVEELGMAPVSRIEELANLCRRHDTCVFLANAQHTVPTLEHSDL